MLYLYAITDATVPPAELPPCVAGILPEAPVRRYTCGSLCAVASPVPEAVFGRDDLPALLTDQAWVYERVMAHERVVSSLLPGTVLPLKFGTLFSGEPALRETLLAHRERLEDALARLRGAREWGVKLFAVPPRTAAEPAGASSAARTGAAFFRRKRDEQEAKQAARAHVERSVIDGHRRLAAHARAEVSSPLQPAAAHRQPGEMVLNGAYLVSAEAEAAFKATFAELAREQDRAGLRYELTGPWVPYHFAGAVLADQ